MGKIRVVVLFGGQSSEHVVSCMSAANVIDRIDQEKYELLLIGITEEGRWIRTECVEDIRSGSWRDGTVSAVISPDATEKCVILMDGESAERIRQTADSVFQAVDGYGLARVDFFVTGDGEVVFNEINTLPGFTAISMYPMLWEARGVSKEELVEKLIAHGLKRFD